MTLKELVKKYSYQTDKHTAHCYIDHLYDELFLPIKNSATNILEIGVAKGGSILLWRDYFSNAIIHGVDIQQNLLSDHTDDKIKIYCDNAYDSCFIDSLLDNYFDVIIDDGPHTLDSMRIFVSKYLSKIKYDGYLILEDIQDISWVDDIKSHIDKSIISKNILYDLRSVKKRYDDIALVIKKLS